MPSSLFHCIHLNSPEHYSFPFSTLPTFIYAAASPRGISPSMTSLQHHSVSHTSIGSRRRRRMSRRQAAEATSRHSLRHSSHELSDDSWTESDSDTSRVKYDKGKRTASHLLLFYFANKNESCLNLLFVILSLKWFSLFSDVINCFLLSLQVMMEDEGGDSNLLLAMKSLVEKNRTVQPRRNRMF